MELLIPGTIMCRRTTGELCMVLQKVQAYSGPSDGTTACAVVYKPDSYLVRRPVMQEKGIDHVIDEVYAFELETIEEHLRHEAKEMLLKIDIQEEMSQAMENAKKSRVEKLMVN